MNPITVEVKFTATARTYDELLISADATAREFFEDKPFLLWAESSQTVTDMTGKVYMFEFEVVARSRDGDGPY